MDANLRNRLSGKLEEVQSVVVGAAVEATEEEEEEEEEDDDDSDDDYVREIIRQVSKYVAPIAAANLLWYARLMVTTRFLERVGPEEIARAASLALAFANLSGWSVLVGLAAGVESLCSRAHGAKKHGVLPHALQRCLLLLLAATVPIVLIWRRADAILPRMGHSRALSDSAQTYLLYLIPDLFATAALFPLRMFLRTESRHKPLLLASAAALVLHYPLTYVLSVTFGFGAAGTAAALTISDTALAVALLRYIHHKLPRRSVVSASPVAVATPPPSWSHILSLSLPCCFMTCFEGFMYEALQVLAARVPRRVETAAVVSAVLSGDAFLYALQVAVATSACIRVANAIGSRRTCRAYRASMAALILALVLGSGAAAYWLVWLRRLRHAGAGDLVSAGVSQLLPYMAVIEVCSFVLMVARAVLRGVGKPWLAAAAYVVSFVCFGFPVMLLLGFRRKMGLVGLWVGLATAAIAAAGSMVTLVLFHTDHCKCKGWRLKEPIVMMCCDEVAMQKP